MAYESGNRIQETTTTDGDTDPYDLEGASDGFRTFRDQISDGATVHYACADDNNYEIGEGTLTYAVPDTISRDVILDSSNGGLAVDWDVGGERTITLCVPAESIQGLIDSTTAEGVNTGILARTAKNTYAGHTIAVSGSGQGASIANGDGVSGAPTLTVYGFSTGDVKLTFKTSADTGWVLMNDGSIGDAGSGATTRANADTQALYTLLWDNVADAWCPVSTGRGGSAAADFAAGKTLTLPETVGRALAASGTGSYPSATARALGENLGAEDYQLQVADLPAHSHGVTDPGHFHNFGTPQNVGGSGSSSRVQKTADTFGTTSSTTGVTIDNTGGDTAHTNMQPTAHLNVMIKL